MKKLFLGLLLLITILGNAQHSVVGGYNTVVINGTSYVVVVGDITPEPGLEAETEAILARATTEGFTLPDEGTIAAINQLIIDYKTNGSWAIYDVYLHFAYNNTGLSNFSRINWANPSGDLITINGSMSYTINGWLNNGTNGNLNTLFDPSTDGLHYTLSNAHRSAVIYSLSASETSIPRLIDGSTTGSLLNTMFALDNGGHRINNAGTFTAQGSAAFNVLGYKLIARNNGDLYLYNGVTDYSRTVSGTYTFGGEQKIFAYSSGNAASGMGISLYSMGGYMDSTKAHSNKTAINTFLTSVGLSTY